MSISITFCKYGGRIHYTFEFTTNRVLPTIFRIPGSIHMGADYVDEESHIFVSDCLKLAIEKYSETDDCDIPFPFRTISDVEYINIEIERLPVLI